jgi:pimeloyl-ACP methyl ester carboxylesterase
MRRLMLCLLLLLLAAGRATAQDYEIGKIAANSAKGFHWPYYLGIPATIKRPAVLLVQPNGTGYPFDDFTPHDAAAFSQAHGTQNPQGLGRLGSPSLVPVFPRPPGLYTQSLDRDTLLTKRQGYERLDLQLIAMVEDARARLAARGITVDVKFWMRGFSATGSFTSRFALLHPHLVKAASVGAAGLGPALPVDAWKGRRLNYPYGVADLESVAGKKFDDSSFRQVAFQIYIGDQDTVSDPEWQPDQSPDQALMAEVFGLPNVPLAYMR